jgi:CRP/FNR family transcriptional regulator
MVTGEGREQVTGFQMAGDLLGMDCVGGTCYHTDAVALDDSEVCVIPYTSLQSLAQRLEPLQHNFHRAMGGEIRRDHRVMVFLGKNTADERVATFLVNLSQRFIALGYSRSNFILRMTREEIGDFLGLQLETVSRTFSKFHGLGLIRVQKRDIRITDLPELQKLGSQLQGSI